MLVRNRDLVIGDAAVDSGGHAFGLFGAEAWDDLTHWIKTWAEYTPAGVGLGTSISQLKGLGVKPRLVGIAAALAVGVASIVPVSLFGPLIFV